MFPREMRPKWFLSLYLATFALQSHAEERARTCGRSPWSTYGKDAGRTSASDSCLDGTATVAWTFAPPLFKGRVQKIAHAIAEDDAVFAVGTRGQAPFMDRLDPNDKSIRWSYDSRADPPRMEWPTIARGIVMYVDHGFTSIDRETGAHKTAFLDAWGPSIIDASRIYAVNKWQEEGPTLFLGAFDDSLKKLWKGAQFSARGIVISDANGIALDAGTLFHAANYHFPKLSFLSALDPATGHAKWKVPAIPESSVSAAAGRLYMVERSGNTEFSLVARSQVDGAVVWKAVIASPLTAGAPVVANDLIIAHTKIDLVALDAASGRVMWRLPLASRPPRIFNATTMAAAMGSHVLVVTAGGKVNFIDVMTGAAMGQLSGWTDVHSPIVVGDAGYVVADGSLVRLQNRADAATRALARR